MSDPKENVLLMPKRHRGQLHSALAEFLDAQKRDENSNTHEALEVATGYPTETDEREREISQVHHTVSINSETSLKSNVEQLFISDIAYSPFQAREIFDEEELQGLSQSISALGVLQPVLVRRSSGERPYELIAGERRLRAANLAGLTTVPAVIFEFSDLECLEAAIIENAQRQDLNPIEEAQAFQRLSTEFKLNQKAIAEVVGKSRVAIANSLRLLQLPIEITELLKSGELTAGHGRALLAVEDDATKLSLAAKAVRDGLSVRALEKLVTAKSEDAFELSEEEELALATLARMRDRVAKLLELESGVSLSTDAQGRKRLQLTFDTEASWKRFMARIRD